MKNRPFAGRCSRDARHAAAVLHPLAFALAAAVCLACFAVSSVRAQEAPLSAAQQQLLQTGQYSPTTTVYIEGLSSLGSSTVSYALEEPYVFVAQGSGILVINVSNPNNPVETARFGPLDGVVRHIAVQDHTLYAALGEGGLAVIDATLPEAMKTLARYPAPMAGYVTVDGEHAYLVDSWHRLLVLDISRPAAPGLVGSLDVSETVYAVSIADQHAYLSLGSAGLSVVAVADPADPRTVAQHSDIRTRHRLEFAGDHAFVINEIGRAYVYDFSSSAAPKESAELSWALRLDIRGNYLYTAGGGGVDVWDISQPAAPAFLMQRQVPPNQAWAEIIAGAGTLYAGTYEGGLWVFDRVQPALPLQVGAFATDTSGAWNTALVDSGLFVGSYETLAYRDLASGGVPASATALSISRRVRVLAACEDKAFIATGLAEPGLEIVQVGDNGELNPAGFLATTVAIDELTCAGAHVFALTADRLLAIDVSNSAQPRQVDSYALPGGAKAMALDAPRVYILDTAQTVHILDISQPAQLRKLGTYEPGDAVYPVQGLVAGASHLYLRRASQVDIVDLSDVSDPRLLDTFSPHEEMISAFYLQEPYLFLYYAGGSSGDGALRFVDVSDPANSEEVALLEPHFQAIDIAVNAGYLAVAGGDLGLTAYWWSPASAETFAAEGVINFSAASGFAYSLDAAQLRPAESAQPDSTVRLTHFRPRLPLRARSGPLREIISAFTLQVQDAQSDALLQPGAPVAIKIALSPDQLETVDAESVALFAWNGAAWEQVPSSHFNPGDGVLSATVAELAPWSVRGAPLTASKKAYLPFVAHPDLDIALSGFELTQSTQTLANSVPLIAGKATLARFYATANATAPARDVSLILTATRDGSTLPGSPIQVGPWAVFPSWDRATYGTSFNVTLPLDWTHGNVTLTATLRTGDGAEDSVPINNQRTVSAQFVDVPALDLVIVPVTYIQTPSGEVYDPPAQERITDWIARLFPISGIRVSYHAPVIFEGDLSTSNGFERALFMIGDIRYSENAPPGRAYYGMLPSVPSSAWAGMGYIGLRASVGTNSGSVAGHELGHNFGRLHAPCGGPAAPDPNYPYAGASIGEYGFDSGSYTIWTPEAGKDFMSYCYPRWTSDYTYLALLADQLKVGSVAAQAADEAVLWVRAVIYEDNGAELLPFYVLAGSPDSAAEDANCLVALRNVEGEPLAVHPVSVHRTADGGSARSVSARLALPPEPVRSVAMLCDGDEIASASLPEVTSAAAPAVPRLEGDTLVLDWDGSGSPVLVQMRRAGEAAWTTLGVDVRSGRLAVDAGTLPGGTVEFRVLPSGSYAAATDAAAQSAIASGAQVVVLDLPDKPPRAWITGPSTAPAGEAIVLFGHGFDVEDGVLDGLTWSVDGVATGDGDRLQLTVPATGSVEVTLTAVDAAGQAAVATHSVEGAAEAD